MRKKDVKYAGWFADFERRCEEQGYSAGKVMMRAGMKYSYLNHYRKGIIPKPSTRLKLENALVSYVPPDPEKSDVDTQTQSEDFQPKPVICEGDKINCPYLTYTSDKKGYCPLQRCKYIIKDGEVSGHVEEQ